MRVIFHRIRLKALLDARQSRVDKAKAIEHLKETKAALDESIELQRTAEELSDDIPITEIGRLTLLQASTKENVVRVSDTLDRALGVLSGHDRQQKEYRELAADYKDFGATYEKVAITAAEECLGVKDGGDCGSLLSELTATIQASLGRLESNSDDYSAA